MLYKFFINLVWDGLFLFHQNVLYSVHSNLTTKYIHPNDVRIITKLAFDISRAYCSDELQYRWRESVFGIFGTNSSTHQYSSPREIKVISDFSGSLPFPSSELYAVLHGFDEFCGIISEENKRKTRSIFTYFLHGKTKKHHHKTPHTSTHTYRETHTHPLTLTHTQAPTTQTWTHRATQTQYTNTHSRNHTLTNTLTQSHTHTHKHSHIDTNTQTHTPTHTQKHTPTHRHTRNLIHLTQQKVLHPLVSGLPF